MKPLIGSAGAIGCYLAGALAENNFDVTIDSSERTRDAIVKEGLTITGGAGSPFEWKNPKFLSVTETNETYDVIFIASKSSRALDDFERLRSRLAPNGVIVFLQNGIRFFSREAKASLSDEQTSTEAMVTSNVVRPTLSTFHKSSDGPVTIGCFDHPWIAQLVGNWQGQSLSLEATSNIEAVKAGKLLMNLNNPINALSNLPLKVQLSERKTRMVLAKCIDEALAVYAKAGISCKSPITIPARFLPWVLRLPNALFLRVAKQTVNVDESARSSMWQDISQGRPTEIDDINGIIVSLGTTYKVPTRVNTRIVSAIKELENEQVFLSIDELSAMAQV